MMSEPGSKRPLPDDLPEPVVRSPNNRISFVWVIPILAAVIGAWLAYRGITEKGPVITISFESAEGLEAGKTKIKYKDVELGKVVKILLSSDRNYVLVKAELDKQAEGLLSEQTLFWVVRARVAAMEIKGLATLFSGAHIAMDPGSPGPSVDHFKGLETPPIVTSGMPGRHFILMADRRSSLDVGSPVYYRQIRVGEVAAYNLDTEGRAIHFNIFIRAPYDQNVFKNTRFWNVSGIDFSLSARGVQLKTETLSTLLMGGIAFNLPEDSSPGERAEEGAVFKFFDNVEASRVKHYALKTRWLIYFNGSVRGLAAGAPVELRGIPIGKVVDVKLKFDEEAVLFNIPVLIEVEPERMLSGHSLAGIEDLKQFLDQLVAKGLRAQLKTGNLLTGQKLVEFDIHPDAPPDKIAWEDPYPRLPTLPGRVETVTSQIVGIIDKLEKLPVEQIAADLQATVQNAKKLSGSPALPRAIDQLNAILDDLQKFVDSLKSDVTPEILKTLRQVQNSLTSARSILDSDADFQFMIKNAMDEVSRSARSLRVLTEYLEHHPEAFIFGKGGK
ncbi:MAG: MlaD family protein [Thermodesulfobacteriota bacterium]|nr:MlaD family protein [Thermodesulfobacteriota bacterium]